MDACRAQRRSSALRGAAARPRRPSRPCLAPQRLRRGLRILPDVHCDAGQAILLYCGQPLRWRPPHAAAEPHVAAPCRRLSSLRAQRGLAGASVRSPPAFRIFATRACVHPDTPACLSIPLPSQHSPLDPSCTKVACIQFPSLCSSLSRISSADASYCYTSWLPRRIALVVATGQKGAHTLDATTLDGQR